MSIKTTGNRRLSGMENSIREEMFNTESGDRFHFELVQGIIRARSLEERATYDTSIFTTGITGIGTKFRVATLLQLRSQRAQGSKTPLVQPTSETRGLIPMHLDVTRCQANATGACHTQIDSDGKTLLDRQSDRQTGPRNEFH
ncbi:hypothetical protein J6590_086011 [Homalodisca vitripennis]|nr:hypothetical protein J6590_086011 [Homalodisca vitripennis]